MTVKVNGTAFADLFDPYVTGAKTCPAGEIFEGVVDIRDAYAPIEFGSKGADTNIHIDGVDVSNYFAAIGTAAYWPDPPFWAGQTYGNTAQRVEPATAQSEVGLSVDGQGLVTFKERTNNGVEVIIQSGNEIPPNIDPTDVEVRCVQNTGEGAFSNTLTDWVSLDGTTTIVGGMIYRISRTAVGTEQDTGTFTLEFREKTNPTRGTAGTFTSQVTATVTQQPQ